MYLKQYKAKKLFGAIGTIIDGSIAYVDLNGFDDFRNLSLWGLKMKVIEIKDRNPILVQQLLDVWESAVKATHL